MQFLPHKTRHRRVFTAAAGTVASQGPLTGVSLADVRRLRQPPNADPSSQLWPRPNETAIRLSLELAYLTYTLELEPWLHSGWTDVSIQVDNHLESGVTVGESENAQSERFHALMNRLRLMRARLEMKERNPVAQLMGALRQRESSDTVKAVTMLHPVGSGHYVVAIGFMGTGTRFYDWVSNLRFTSQEGFHKGFYQLAQFFEQSADRIFFPNAAAALGVPSLTLRAVLGEMRSPDSRFSLWMAGHSQGAAVMQIFCHSLLDGWGVLPRHVVGYGFASPTVAVGGLSRNPADYPLFHVINSDDLVPLVGALNHLGTGLYYPADEALRNAAYGWADTPRERTLLSAAETLLGHVTDTPSMLAALAALLETISEEKTEESLRTLMDKPWSIAPLDKAFGYAGGKTLQTIARMGRYLRVAYRSVSGRRVDEHTVDTLKDEMRPVVRAFTVHELASALNLRMRSPHTLRRSTGETGAYEYIVRRGLAALRPFIWQGEPPRRVYMRGSAARAQTARICACARGPRRPALPSARSHGITALRAGHAR